MPELDVSDVLTDPDFLDQLVCIRTTQGIGPNGVVFAASQQLLQFYGVVTSDRGLLLEREAAGSRIDGSIVVVTKFRLQDGSTIASLAADIVQWNNQQWTVVHIDPYTRYGAGFVQALCDLIPVTG